SLVSQSVVAQNSSYSPYSNFSVGAAILLENKSVVLGSNQENAAYPSGLCAERVAIYSCGAHYPKDKILAIAISANSSKFDIKDLLAPCGACRQSMMEFEFKQNAPIKVLLKGVGNQVVEFNSIKDLLPIPFNSEALQIVSENHN
ncbi:cytidine deaminase, partial [Flavobacteriales bacterium]|nr:cytidine deaminase [Flavobacteriales bacterium]